MYDAILVGIDDSETATEALEHAIGLADSLDATLHVLSVIEPTGSPLTFGVGEVDDLNTSVTRVIDDILAAGDVEELKIEAEIRRGRSDEVILDYATEADVDLIVLGQRGRSGLPAAILGSTTDRVSRLSSVPVTVVPGSE